MTTSKKFLNNNREEISFASPMVRMWQFQIENDRHIYLNHTTTLQNSSKMHGQD